MRQNGTSARFTVAVNGSIADGCVRLAGGVHETRGLGPEHGAIEIGKA